MICPYCKNPTRVTNSRKRAKGTQTWRRRECTECSRVWTTHEVIDLSTSHKVVDSQGNIQPFQRDKLFMSIEDSLRHRKTSLSDATALTDTIIARILALNSPELTTKQLSDITHSAITLFDKTAAAVYKASGK